eukprot:scaffold42094_cov18-Tisochrysis_lutea.AAC.1
MGGTGCALSLSVQICTDGGPTHPYLNTGETMSSCPPGSSHICNTASILVALLCIHLIKCNIASIIVAIICCSLQQLPSLLLCSAHTLHLADLLKWNDLNLTSVNEAGTTTSYQHQKPLTLHKQFTDTLQVLLLLDVQVEPSDRQSPKRTHKHTRTHGQPGKRTEVKLCGSVAQPLLVRVIMVDVSDVAFLKRSKQYAVLSFFGHCRDPGRSTLQHLHI